MGNIVVGPEPKEGVDQRDELQTWINSLLPGDVAKLKMVGPKGAKVAPEYICEETLFLNDLQGVTFKTNGAKLRRTALIGNRPWPNNARLGWHQQVRIQNCRDLIFRLGGLYSVGDGTYSSDYEGEHAVQIKGGERIQLEVDEIDSPASEWVNVQHHEPGGNQRLEAVDIRISHRENAENALWSKAGRQGLSVTGRVTRVTFEDLNLGRAPRSMLDIELVNITDVANAVVFRDSYVEGYGNFLLANGGPGASVGTKVLNVTSPIIKIKVGQALNEDGTPKWSRFDLEVSDTVDLEPRPDSEGRPFLYATGLTGLTLRNNVLPDPQPVGGWGGFVAEPIIEEGNSWQA